MCRSLKQNSIEKSEIPTNCTITRKIRYYECNRHCNGSNIQGCQTALRNTRSVNDIFLEYDELKDTSLPSRNFEAFSLLSTQNEEYFDFEYTSFNPE